MMTSGDSSREIERAIAGDQAALERLLIHHYQALANFIGPRIPNRHRGAIDVEDVLQQAFICVFRDIGGFEPHGDAAFFVWLRTIADKRLTDAIRAANCRAIAP